MRRVVDHVTSHLDADLTASALAALVGVSERHLNRLFARELDQTPGRFVREARTEAAAQLLSTTSLPVSRVATQCGFRSSETLRQAFVAQYEIPPSRYRLSHRSGPATTVVT